MTGEKRIVSVSSQNGGSEPSNINTVPFTLKLNDTNFKVWSKMMEVHAAGLNELGYLSGKTVKVEEEDPGYSKWVIEDAVVRGWLLKTMEPHLLGMFIELPTAQPRCSMMEKMKPNIMNCVVRQPGFDKMVVSLIFTLLN